MATDNILASNKQASDLASRLHAAEDEMLMAKQLAKEAAQVRYDLQSRIKSMIARTSEDKMSDRMKGDLEALKRDLQTATESVDREEGKINALRREIEGLKLSIDGCEPRISIKEIKTLKTDISKVVEDIQGIESLIAENREAILAHDALKSDLNTMYAQRDDLRAEIAIGDKAQSDMDQLDAKIAAKKAEVDSSADSAENARFLVQGLQRKLPPLRDKLSELTSLKKPLALAFVREQAKVTVDRYTESAKQTADLFQQLHVINQFIVSLGGSAITSPNHLRMLLPAFYIHEDDSTVGYRGNVFSHLHAMDHGGYVGVKPRGFEDLKELGVLD